MPSCCALTINTGCLAWLVTFRDTLPMRQALHAAFALGPHCYEGPHAFRLRTSQSHEAFKTGSSTSLGVNVSLAPFES